MESNGREANRSQVNGIGTFETAARDTRDVGNEKLMPTATDWLELEL